MARIDINVPYNEKDEAKRLGARWDATRKTWYIPDGVPTSD
ncbi:TPA: DNA primase, partial [Escherichia coli]|nr:DNA primase [Escherichia coli]